MTLCCSHCQQTRIMQVQLCSRGTPISTDINGGIIRMNWLWRCCITRTIWLMTYFTNYVSFLIAPSLYTFAMSKLQTATAGTWGLHVLLFIFLLANTAFNQFRGTIPAFNNTRFPASFPNCTL
eukprot:Gb_09262 [translate_table: standard]